MLPRINDSRRLVTPRMATLLAVFCTGMLAGGAAASGDRTSGTLRERETYSVTYHVRIVAGSPRARVRWDLAGIDEISRIRLRTPPERFADIEASGTVERRPGEVLWHPNAPYGHLTYTVALDHRRAADKGYDSYLAPEWLISRTSDLFPRAAVLYRRDVEADPESRARLVFDLPPGWGAVTAMPPVRPRIFEVETPSRRFDHPRGWLMLGRFTRNEDVIAGTTVTIAAAQGVHTSPADILHLFARALPEFTGLLQVHPSRLLVVMGPDPMWRGGLSGEESFFMHGARHLQSPDGSSPYLHELFHVLAPFRPTADASWVTEGLAEYYSVVLQQRTGDLDAAAAARAIQLFGRQGIWGQDFTRHPPPSLRNNSAPFVMAVLDQRIRSATDGAQSLDDVVRVLATEGGRVSTAHFLGAVRRVSGKNLGAFFRRHVYSGKRPVLRRWPPPSSAPPRNEDGG